MSPVTHNRNDHWEYSYSDTRRQYGYTSPNMPHATSSTDSLGSTLPAMTKPIKKLVLCFDGTGNTFTGTSSDTNIVKLYDMFNRDDPYQYHYYQTGIGTYDIGSGSVNKSFIRSIWSSISRTLDQGMGTTFDHHVMAGYKFLMNHYDSGDKIYMFGFSRGAFTARFLARMVHKVGLLSKGNDEMVPFAYQLYQKYAQRQIEADEKKNVRAKLLALENEISAFSRTFCRKENGQDVKVYFLGLFDCVNSVKVLEVKPNIPLPITETAVHVRHAVAVDEFRVKFKPSLFHQDQREHSNKSNKRISKDIKAQHKIHPEDKDDIREVWFPGNHGDVGGGWPAEPEVSKYEKPGSWAWLKKTWTTSKMNETDCARLQMSDIPLDWMVRELEIVNEKSCQDRHPDWAVRFSQNKDEFKKRIRERSGLDEARYGRMHNTMSFGGGSSLVKCLVWKFMEWLPFISRWEIVRDKWELVRFPSTKEAHATFLLMQSCINLSAIDSATFQASTSQETIMAPLKKEKDLQPCLIPKHGKVDLAKFKPEEEDEKRLEGVKQDPMHMTYQFASYKKSYKLI